MIKRYEQAMLALSKENPESIAWYQAYDDLVWALVSSHPADLAMFCERFGGYDHDATPVPIKVLAYRLLAHASTNDLATRDDCIKMLDFYCAAGEFENVLAGFPGLTYR
jgi:hypothetical protein